MGQPQPPSFDYAVPESASLDPSKYYLDVHGSHNTRGSGSLSSKKRGHNLGNRSWIKIDRSGNSSILEQDKFTIMKHCNLPSSDLRLLDPLFIYPSTILGRESAIVVCLEQIRCIITADEVILMNSLDGSVLQYKSELCKRLETSIDQSDDLPFEFRALELALEFTCMSLDAQLKEYIDDTEDLINIKLRTVQNQLIKFELLLTAATFVATIFAVVTAVFGTNFEDSVFDLPTTFNWVLVVSGVFCVMLYSAFVIYFWHKKVFPL